MDTSPESYAAKAFEGYTAKGHGTRGHATEGHDALWFYAFVKLQTRKYKADNDTFLAIS